MSTDKRAAEYSKTTMHMIRQVKRRLFEKLLCRLTFKRIDIVKFVLDYDKSGETKIMYLKAMKPSK